MINDTHSEGLILNLQQDYNKILIENKSLKQNINDLNITISKLKSNNQDLLSENKILTKEKDELVKKYNTLLEENASNSIKEAENESYKSHVYSYYIID